jgi:uncharacterized SAM-binding protein YcdF (DUF218 family)
MFFLLSKILIVFLSPMTWIGLLIIISLFSKKKSLKKRINIATVSVFIFFSNPFIADEFMRAWEIPATNQADLNRYDVGIVLTGMCTYDTQFQRINFDKASDRLLQAIDLYHKGYIDKIFISGGSGKVREPNFHEAKLLHDYLVMTGIPDSDVDYEIESRNTHENAMVTAKYLNVAESDSRFLLITSAFHMRRAAACFKQAGFVCDYYSTDRYTGDRKYHIEHLFIPSVSAFHRWEVLFKEWIGLIMYKIKNYV